MISGLNTESEVLASLNVAQALLVALHKKGILSDQEVKDLLADASNSMSASPFVEIKGAAKIVETMKQDALAH